MAVGPAVRVRKAKRPAPSCLASSIAIEGISQRPRPSLARTPDSRFATSLLGRGNCYFLEQQGCARVALLAILAGEVLECSAEIGTHS